MGWYLTQGARPIPISGKVLNCVQARKSVSPRALGLRVSVGLRAPHSQRGLLFGLVMETQAAPGLGTLQRTLLDLMVCVLGGTWSWRYTWNHRRSWALWEHHFPFLQIRICGLLSPYPLASLCIWPV